MCKNSMTYKSQFKTHLVNIYPCLLCDSCISLLPLRKFGVLVVTVCNLFVHTKGVQSIVICGMRIKEIGLKASEIQTEQIAYPIFKSG
jgi:hypothetical protein